MNADNITLEPVAIGQKEILRNLLEKYDYEFSQYEDNDVNDLGLFGYDYLDYYWTEKNRWAFFIRVEGKLAGFAMVNDFPESERRTDYCLSEFFILYKYRRCGVGSYVARWLWDRFPGSWHLKYHPHNLPSVEFWNRAVDSYTGGKFERLEGDIEATKYRDGTQGMLLFFDTTSAPA